MNEGDTLIVSRNSPHYAEVRSAALVALNENEDREDRKRAVRALMDRYPEIFVRQDDLMAMIDTEHPEGLSILLESKEGRERREKQERDAQVYKTMFFEPPPVAPGTRKIRLDRTPDKTC